MPLILASRSPRRQQLLAQFGLAFDIREADLNEARLQDETPEAMTERLAIAKAMSIFRQSQPDSWVIGGDTTVAIGDEVLGKPRDHQEAIRMLSALSANSHRVVSAVALIGREFSKSLVSTTVVTFDYLSASQIRSYCDSGEPFDKAGGYGIQGLAGAYVKELRGSYSGVVGLPLFETRKLLEQAQLLN